MTTTLCCGVVYTEEDGTVTSSPAFSTPFTAKQFVRGLDPRSDAEIVPWGEVFTTRTFRTELAGL